MVVRDVVKRYPNRPVNAVDGVSFEVGRGEVFGLLGPNGAGKTTIVGILTTRARATGGQALVAGFDVALDPVGARTALAVVPQRMNLDRSLSARRNLLFHGAYFGLPPAVRVARADALLDEFGLTDRANDKVDRFSGGQMQRVMIARALMHQPRVLFLDEPSTGLDPQARLFVWDRIRSLRRRGVTVVLTTHDMDEAASLADRVAIMDHGKLLTLDTPTGLTSLVPGRATLTLALQPGAADPKLLQASLQELSGVERVEQLSGTGAAGQAGIDDADEGIVTDRPLPSTTGEGQSQAALDAAYGDDPPWSLRLYCSVDAAGLVAPVVQVLLDHGAAVTDIGVGRPSLEDVFIHLTGRELRG
ncbi:MAG: ABC transporter ATP-binding protein [Acidimicrobiales bacterium]